MAEFDPKPTLVDHDRRIKLLERKLMLAERSLTSRPDRGRYIYEVDGGIYSINNLACTYTSGMSFTLKDTQIDFNGVVVPLDGAIITVPANTTRWYFADYNMSTGTVSVIYDSSSTKPDDGVHAYLPLCKVVTSNSAIIYLINVVSLPYGGDFFLGYKMTAVWYPMPTGGIWYNAGDHLSCGCPDGVSFLVDRQMRCQVYLKTVNASTASTSAYTYSHSLMNWMNGSTVGYDGSALSLNPQWWGTLDSYYDLVIQPGTPCMFCPGIQWNVSQQYQTQFIISGRLTG